ncbi:MAG: RNA methyltransferase [bacterium]|nr:RNA methyltransferase [bacterium]
MATAKRLEKIKQVAMNRFKDVVVVLEDVHDPHNGLASLRNCDAFGIQQVHFIFETEKEFNPKKIGRSSSSSANKWLNFKIWQRSEECFRALKQDGYLIWVTMLDSQAEVLWDVDFNQEKIALVFGNEHSGVSKTAKDWADKKIIIPMSGFVESLNLSVSVGVVLYELRRQRRSATPTLWHQNLIKDFKGR